MAKKKVIKKVSKKNQKKPAGPSSVKTAPKKVRASAERGQAKPAAAGSSPKTVSRKEASKRIVDITGKIYNDITGKKKKPEMKFPIRSLSNVRYDSKRGYFEIQNKVSTRTLTYNTAKTFAQSMRLMATTKKDLLDKNDIAGKREVYYNSKSWGECRFDQQPESDTLLDDMEAMLGINREQLGYIPEERGGDVAGPLKVIDQNPVTGRKIKIDCAQLGSGAWSIPSRVEQLEFETKAKMILVIETASLFQRLVHHLYYEKANCILVSMSGVPTRACRRFIRRLADDRGLPVLVFTDGDPYGYCNIYRTLKVGSGQSAHINKFFCVPQAHYLGVTPQDIIDYKLEDATHPLETPDIKRANDALKNDPFIAHHKEWQDVLKQMLDMGVRIEQQAFAKHGLNFVLEHYLPEKMKKGKFLP